MWFWSKCVLLQKAHGIKKGQIQIFKQTPKIITKLKATWSLYTATVFICLFSMISVCTFRMKSKISWNKSSYLTRMFCADRLRGWTMGASVQPPASQGGSRMPTLTRTLSNQGWADLKKTIVCNENQMKVMNKILDESYNHFRIFLQTRYPC